MVQSEIYELSAISTFLANNAKKLESIGGVFPWRSSRVKGVRVEEEGTIEVAGYDGDFKIGQGC